MKRKKFEIFWKLFLERKKRGGWFSGCYLIKFHLENSLVQLNNHSLITEPFIKNKIHILPRTSYMIHTAGLLCQMLSLITVIWIYSCFKPRSMFRNSVQILIIVRLKSTKKQSSTFRGEFRSPLPGSVESMISGGLWTSTGAKPPIDRKIWAPPLNSNKCKPPPLNRQICKNLQVKCRLTVFESKVSL